MSGEGQLPSFASVLVDVGARRTDREYHYRIPPSLLGRVQPGHRVSVPFGSRKLVGVVVDLVTEPEVEDLKDLEEVLEDDPIISPDMLDLARWLSGRYLALRIHCLKLLFPAGVKKNAPLPRGREIVRLSLAGEELEREKDRIARRAPAQYRLLSYLQSHPEKLTRTQLTRAAGVTSGVVRTLIDRGLLTVEEEQKKRAARTGALCQRPSLTDEQAVAVRGLTEDLSSPRPGRWLLHGITGSGKTEVYLRLAEECLSRQEGSIILVPEISLTPQMVGWFRDRLGPGVAVLHSGLRDRQRYLEWERVRSGDARVVVGARSAVFAPIRDLGLVVVDEEHERSYKQEESPRYHAREVARERARREGALLVLGSATPSVETYYQAMNQEMGYLRLGKRVSGRPAPRIDLVDMREELRRGNRSIFSRQLKRALKETVTGGSQAILLLNRRGYAAFLLCRVCGLVMKCPQCEVSLTVHASGRNLVCHYCHHTAPTPPECPTCGDTRIRPMGTGTEKVEQAIRSVLPHARVIRMDADTTSRPGSHAAIYHDFRRGRAHILVGTQMVAKGWDIPSVTLVGVINADVALNLPDFRAGERTYQLMTQVAGRAGRGQAPATVLVQTYSPEHPAIRAAAFGDEEAFYRQELQTREALVLPPFSHLARVLVRSASESEAAMLARDLAREAGGWSPQVSVLGPGPAPFGKLRGKYRWHLALKAVCRDTLTQCLLSLKLEERERAGLQVIVDVDPESML